jgi:hypothetical protein
MILGADTPHFVVTWQFGGIAIRFFVVRTQAVEGATLQ